MELDNDGFPVMAHSFGSLLAGGFAGLDRLSLCMAHPSSLSSVRDCGRRDFGIVARPDYASGSNLKPAAIVLERFKDYER
jgi:hypothetical protein